MRRFFALIVLSLTLSVTFGEPVTGGGEPQSSTSDVRVVVDPLDIRVGTSAPSSVRLDTPQGFELLGIRFQTSPNLVRVKSWAFGAGLNRHIAEHGEPPICDIIVYPDGTGLFAIMALAEPYSSEEYGDEWLTIEYEVTAQGPRASCLFIQSDTEDYEAGSVSRLSQLLPGSPRRCVRLNITPAARFRRGDVDGSGDLAITDAIRLLSDLFVDPQPAPCPDASDMNDDGVIDVADPVQILSHVLLGDTGGLDNDCTSDDSDDTLPACDESRC